MIDELTKDRIRVSSDGIAGPYPLVPMAQLAHVREVLDRHQFRHWPDSSAVSLDGKPAIVMVNFGRAGDPTRIQRLLDEAG